MFEQSGGDGARRAAADDAIVDPGDRQNVGRGAGQERLVGGGGLGDAERALVDGDLKELLLLVGFFFQANLLLV